MVADPKENNDSKQNDEQAAAEELRDEQLKDIAGGTVVPSSLDGKIGGGPGPQLATPD